MKKKTEAQKPPCPAADPVVTIQLNLVDRLTVDEMLQFHLKAHGEGKTMEQKIGELLREDVREVGHGFSEGRICVACGGHGRVAVVEVKVGDRVMYRLPGKMRPEPGTVNFIAHGMARMVTGELVGTDRLTVLTAAEEAGLFGDCAGTV